jgi:hypothetical protein
VYSRKGAQIVTTFRDGPAVRACLQLTRAPQYLRVILKGRNDWDALDQLDDTPPPGCRIWAYYLVSDSGTVQTRTGMFRRAEYAVIDEQPPDCVLRENRQWRAYASALAELANAEERNALPE